MGMRDVNRNGLSGFQWFCMGSQRRVRGDPADETGRSLSTPCHLQLLEDGSDIVFHGLIAQLDR